jgi:hypothetical protein
MRRTTSFQAVRGRGECYHETNDSERGGICLGIRQILRKRTYLFQNILRYNIFVSKVKFAPTKNKRGLDVIKAAFIFG